MSETTSEHEKELTTTADAPSTASPKEASSPRVPVEKSNTLRVQEAIKAKSWVVHGGLWWRTVWPECVGVDARGARWGRHDAGSWARGRSSGNCLALHTQPRLLFGVGSVGVRGGFPPKRYARMVCRKLLRLRTGESRRSLVVAAMYVRYISQVKSRRN